MGEHGSVFMDVFYKRIHSDGDKPFFLQPTTLGYFSLDKFRTFCNDSSALVRFRVLENSFFPIDLNVRVEPGCNKKYKHFYSDYMEHLLRYMSANVGRFFVPNREGPGLQAIPTVVCSMELLQTLMCTPYNLKDNWRILVNRYRHTTYMCLENPGEPSDIASLQKRNNMETVLAHVLYKGGENHSESQPEALSQLCNVFFANISDSITALYEAPMGAACLYSGE